MNPLLRNFRLRGGAIGLGVNYLSSLGLANGNSLTIPVGETWINDLSVSPTLSYLTLNGTLIADTTKSTALNVAGIDGASTGSYLVGTAGSRLSPSFTHALTVSGSVPAGRILGPTHTSGNVSRGTPNDGGGLSRGIMLADGCRFELYGYDYGVTNTTLYDTHVTAGDTSIRVAGVVNWKAGHSFTLGMTKFLQSLSQADSTEVLTLASDSVVDASNLFSTLTLSSAAAYSHWGKLQYGTGAGMSLTNDGYTSTNLDGHTPIKDPANPGVDLTGSAKTTFLANYASEINTAISGGRKNILDQRAPVSLLTRNIVISAPNDTAFSGDERFGVHIMKMGLTGSLLMDSVEVTRCGQGGALGRYPIHWHMNSYNSGTGAYLGSLSTASNTVNKCSIHQSWNRGITFHGCRGAKASNNTVHDVVGHVIFFEDGSEKSNTADGNFVTKWRAPTTAATTPAPSGYRIKDHDKKPAGIWVTNVNNTIKNNRVSDGDVGLWINQGTACFGLSALVPITPYYEPVGLWDNNTAHSCYRMGSRIAFGVVDEFGAFGSTGAVDSRDTGLSSGTVVASPFSNETLWKNNGSGLTDEDGNRGLSTGNHENIVTLPQYEGWVVADALGQDFFGNTSVVYASQEFCRKSLFVGISLNSESIQGTTVLPRQAFASYHGSIAFLENTYHNYQPRTPRYDAAGVAHYGSLESDCALSTWDLYQSPLEPMWLYNTGNHFIDSLTTWRSPGTFFTVKTTLYTAWESQATASARLSEVGSWGPSHAVIDWDGRLGGLNIPKSFLIFDHPFITTGISDLTTPQELNSIASVQKVTQTPMYGFEVWNMAGLPALGTTYPDSGNPHPNPYKTSGSADPRVAGGIKYFRCDPTTLADVSGAVIDFDYAGQSFGAQRTCIPRGAAVRVSTAAYNETGLSGTAVFFGANLTGFWRTTSAGFAANDFVYIGVDWPSSNAPSDVFFKTGSTPSADGFANTAVPLVASKAALLALTGYDKASMGYWRDTTNNMIWLRVAWNQSQFGTKTDTLSNWDTVNNITCIGITP